MENATELNSPYLQPGLGLETLGTRVSQPTFIADKKSGSPSLLIRQAMHIVDFFKFAFEVDGLEGKGGLLKTNTFSQTYTTHYLVQPHDQSRFKNLLREKL